MFASGLPLGRRLHTTLSRFAVTAYDRRFCSRPQACVRGFRRRDDQALRYLDWVYHVSGRGGLSLYDSSVSAPDALLAEAARKTFGSSGQASLPPVFGGGSMAMRSHLADAYGISNDRVVATSGVSSGLALVFAALAHRDDHVLIERPGYQPFEDMARAAGLHAECFVRSGPQMRPDLADLRKRLRPETRMIVLSHLHNPTGLPLLDSDLAALAELCEAAGIRLVLDEIYGAFADDRGLAALRSPAVISLSGLSKIFGLGALRCGWIVASAPVAQRLRHASVHHDTGLSAVSHAIGLAVLRDWRRFRARTQDILDANRPIMEDWLTRMAGEGLVSGGLSPWGCLAFPGLEGMARTDGFAAWLLATRGVIVAPGHYWGAPAHIRLGFGMAQDNLVRGLAELEQSLRDYATMDEPQRRAVDAFSL
jgi:aspartate/methionine/tyrosine aminotransferase